MTTLSASLNFPYPGLPYPEDPQTTQDLSLLLTYLLQQRREDLVAFQRRGLLTIDRVRWWLGDALGQLHHRKSAANKPFLALFPLPVSVPTYIVEPIYSLLSASGWFAPREELFRITAKFSHHENDINDQIILRLRFHFGAYCALDADIVNWYLTRKAVATSRNLLVVHTQDRLRLEPPLMNTAHPILVKALHDQFARQAVLLHDGYGILDRNDGLISAEYEPYTPSFPTRLSLHFAKVAYNVLM